MMMLLTLSIPILGPFSHSLIEERRRRRRRRGGGGGREEAMCKGD